MESNREEALRALSIAQKRRDAGDYDSARRFAEKSLRLFETPEGKKLLDSIDSQAAKKEDPVKSYSSSTETHPSFSGSTHRHTQSQANTKNKEEEVKPREYTAENVAVVKRVRGCKVTEYYEILDLKRECEDSAIKKAYRKVRKPTFSWPYAILFFPSKLI
jgi:DnaJ homolog subfamily B member 12